MSDPRTTLARPDLAADWLEGLLPAAAYAAPTAMHCAVPWTGLYAAADSASEQPDQLLFGEAFDVLEVEDGWAWGQASRDGYVGHVRMEALAKGALEPTHRVAMLRAAALHAPDLKGPPVGLYSLNALVAVQERQGRFVRAMGTGWFVETHLAPIGVFETDPAAVAERLIGAPYVWGGRDSGGMDCSGLVQQALHACGHACPRDTDQQFAVFDRAVERDGLRRGDLVFWTGHVGMMLDGSRLIHANGDHAAVAVEPLDIAIGRIAAVRGRVTGYRRP